MLHQVVRIRDIPFSGNQLIGDPRIVKRKRRLYRRALRAELLAARVVMAGDLDSSFDQDGIATISIGEFSDFAWGVAIDRNAKIVVAGSTYNGNDYDFALTRFNRDGSVDQNFGNAGKVTTDLGDNNEIKKVAIQSDGKILAVGSTYNGNNLDVALVRYNPDGTLDTSFDGDGKLTYSFGNSDDISTDVILQQDGKIIVSGYSLISNRPHHAIARINPNGSFDTAFNGSGKVTTDYGYSKSLAIQSDGKLVVAGSNFLDGTYSIALARYNTNGSLDTSFGVAGKVRTSLAGDSSGASSVAVLRDGKLIVAGEVSRPEGDDLALVRYNMDGSLDTSFGSGGYLTSDAWGPADKVTDMLVQIDGKILISGFGSQTTANDLSLVRYEANGLLDTSFGVQGYVHTDIAGDSDDRARGIALQLDGRIVLAGTSLGNFAVTRYDNDLNRMDGDDTWQNARDMGVIPGVHTAGKSIEDPVDKDWYRFDLLKSDDLKFDLSFDPALGALSFNLMQIVQGVPVVRGTSAGTSSGATLISNQLPAGKYYLQVFGSDSPNDYGLDITPSSTSSTRVLYVNDTITSNDTYTLAAGNAANTGLSATSPKASIQQVLDAYSLGANDLVKIDTGNYTTPVTATASDEGVTYVGAPGGSRLDGTFEMVDSDYNTLYRLTFGASSTPIYIRSTSADPTTNTTLKQIKVLSSSIGVRIEGGTDHALIDSDITGTGSYGVYMPSGGSISLTGTSISGRSIGGYFGSLSSANLDGNDVAATTYALYFADSSNLTINNNDLHEAQYGIYRYNGGNSLVTGNRLLNNQVGAYSNVSNTTYRGNTISSNGTGLLGHGVFGGPDWDTANVNVIQNNSIGIRPANGQTVSFNRIFDNQIGIQPQGAATLKNNLMVRNATGVLIAAVSNVSLVNNTIVTPSGTGVRLQQSSSNVSLRNNILSTHTGTGLYVATDSQQGFSSDYNNHYSSGDATLIWWQKPFMDVFDWQVESDLDRHSLGKTALDPNRDAPEFVNDVLGSYHLRSASTSVDAGDPSDLFNLEPAPNGNRIDLGAYGNTVVSAPSASKALRIEYPEYYADWPAAEGRPILWSSYDVTTSDKKLAGSVNIDLYQEGVGFVTQIAIVPAASGSYGWSPEISGIVGSLTNRYFIRISSVDNAGLVDRSREVFSVPPSGSGFYVNDNATTGDETTTAIGNNRNTGKSPNDPKANLIPLLRSYDLGPGDTVRIDTGDYIQIRNVVLSGNPSLGDDEGLTITGPTDPTKVARLDRANPYTGSTNIELNDADFVTLKNLTLTGAGMGLWVRQDSTNFFGNRLVSSVNTTDGIRIDSPIGNLSDSVVFANGGTGIALSNPGPSQIEANRIYGNRVGITVYNSTGGNPALVGNPDLTSARGNLVYGNNDAGIRVDGNVLVVGNSVWGQAGTNAIGIQLSSSQSEARHNVVYDNFYGIQTGYYYAPKVIQNRVFDNSSTGIRAYDATIVSGNDVYSNSIGVEGVWYSSSGFTGSLQNNLVYANSTQGVRIDRGNNARLTNNTVYQTTGNAVHVEGNSANVAVRNNILWVDSGFDLYVANDSQQGFQSDFNVLYTTGTGKVAYWQGAAKTTLNAWYNTVFQDENSLNQNPRFVDPAGPDGILGYRDNPPGDFGSDDDFHEQCDLGSFHGGSLAPVRDTTTGLPVMLSGSWVNDAVRSPVIDRGRATDAFSNEPANNGNFLNIGAYGNTVQASKSPAQYVMVTRPDGGEVWPSRQTFPIRWRSHDSTSTVDIELWQSLGSSPVSVIASGTANDGEYLWQIPDSTVAANNYVIRIRRSDDGTLVDSSNSPIEITPPVTVYYVNDNSATGDEYTTAVGDNANTGLTPHSPKASVSAILAAYDLGPGDIIRVDVGTYTLAGNVAITPDDSGVRIEGPALGSAVLNRGNTNAGSYVVELAGADDVTISRLTLTGGHYGVYASNSADSDRFRLENSIVTSNGLSHTANISIGSSNEDASMVGNTISNSLGYGIVLEGARGRIQGNEIFGNTTGVYSYYLPVADRIEITGNQIHHNTGTGVRASGQVWVANNTVWGHSSSNSTGISASDATVESNQVFDNFLGINSAEYSRSLVTNNRVYRNATTGIKAYDQTKVLGNTVYSNSIGIEGAAYSRFIGEISNNLVYANSNQGIKINYGGNGARITNNTVYQPVGNAVLIEGNSNNVALRNNILHVGTGSNIVVNSDSQVGFNSDYNTLTTSGSGKLAQWGSQTYSSLADLRYEIGLDEHSIVSDPQFIDLDGADNTLGFSYTPVAGTTRIIDNGDADFSVTGTWSNSSSGYQADSAEGATNSIGDRVATWTFNNLDPNAWYEVAVTWPARSALNGYATFKVVEGSSVRSSSTFDQRSAPNDFSDSGVSWERLGTHYVRGSSLSVQLSNYSNLGTGYFSSADAVRIQKIEGNLGSDDNFQVSSTSPTIDTGDPASFYIGEPTPNGRRVNQGYTGNTALAANSAAEMVQVLSPNGLDKYEVGQPVTIAWQSSGLTQVQPAIMLNVGAGTVSDWQANAYQIGSGFSSSTFTNSVDRSGISDPAPETVYQSYIFAHNGIGKRLSWQLPTANGNYTLRLHFAEPWITSVGSRKFDVNLQGATVTSNYDIYAAAGAVRKATTLSYSVNVSGGTGLALDLISKTDQGALLSGIELLTENPTGVASPTANVELSNDNGVNWSTLATNLAMDRFGKGQFVWTPTAETSQAQIRVRANHGSNPSDLSDGVFSVANNGTHYYINDNSTNGDLLATAIGDNRNTGKSPGQPMASVAALVAAYDLDAGDIIHVDAGSYGLVRNVVLASQDSGVRIEGPALGSAVLNRGNTNAGSYVVELAGADDVTISRLTLTGGHYGVYASNSADSDRFRLENSIVTSNGLSHTANISIGSSNEDASMVGNTISNSLGYGIVLEGARGRIQGNEIFGNTTGVYSYYLPVADRIEITGNQIHHNTGTGVRASGQVWVANNTVWGHSSSNSTGISASDATVESNQVFDNFLGINSAEYSRSLVTNNRVYRNATTGIKAYDQTKVLGNTVYSNSIGIEGAAYSRFIGEISNNLVYANSNQGIKINYGGNGARITNNTVYQPVGNAVLIEGNSNNVALRNNILHVGTGSNIVVNSDSQVGFNSDYNTLTTSGSGKLAQWGSQTYSSLADLRYEIGLDEHSIVSDPQFIDLDGADNTLGFSYTPVAGTTRIIDNGDADFSVTGTWSNSSSGYQADSAEGATNSIGDRVATWTFNNLDPNAWYEVAVTWPARSALNGYATFKVVEGSSVRSSSTFDQRSAPNDFSDSGVSWERLGTHYVRGSSLSVQLSNYSNLGTGYFSSADAVRIQKIEGNLGSDDNFQVSSTSPTIDTGDPASFYIGEPTPNGRRVNQGYTGNTALAANSAAEMVQVLSPNGLDKYEVGQPVTIAWQSSGLTQVQPAIMLNVGAGTVSDWQANAYQIGSGFSSSTFTNSVDRSGISDPAPETVYQSYIFAHNGIGKRLSWQLPTANGNYTLRLHFAEPWITSVGSRKFDVNLQGATVTSNYDIYAAAGAVRKATTLSYSVNVSGGTGLALDLISKTDQGALLSGIELLTENPTGVASPTANVELSNDNGVNWSTLATNLAMDRFGKGQFVWTPTAETSQAQIRVRANHGSNPSDLSDGVFSVANNGTHYYINDNSTNGDLLATAIGDNRNTGKSPGQPMASVAALVAAYDLDAGDIIHVDAGSYGLVRNVVLASQDSGVRIEGPALGSAVLNRGNTNAGSYVVELAGADDVTISRLTLTGGHYGVYASNSADSDRFRLENSIVTSNGLSHTANISIGSSNEDASMVGNTISNSLGYGIVLEGARGRIQGNEIFGNTTGVYSYYLPVADRIEITGNQIHHNTGTGVRASGQVWVANNTVWGHSSSNSTGISASDATVESNQVFDNFLGINSAEYSRSLVTNNRVYRNATTGIKAYDQTKVLGNTVYSNSIGIEGAAYSRFIGEISNNLVYANSNQGIKINYGGNGARITNNTVYQPVGNAVLIEGNSNNVALRNNILWVDAGNDIYVTNDSKTGFSSNYNLLYTGPDVNANVGYWDQGGDTKRDTLADWRLATGQDGRSIDSNPNFVDLDGADNVLGYSTLGTGYNGGLDDNFYQARLSGAIDSADAWAAPATDILGRPRVNDPGVGNTGSSDYVESGLGSSQFAVAGTAKGWRWNGTYWNLNFPAGFTFPFYESNYSSVSVSTEGFLYFAGSMSPGDNDNSTDKLKANRIIAPLWDNIHTNGSGDDIFVDTSVAGQVTIRWNATNEANNADVNFSVTLSNDGSIQFNYGSGNTGLTPTVGISRGDGNIHVLSTYNNASTLTNAESIRFVLTPGVTFADMGAYEFRGNSNDAAPPQIVGTDPAFIEASGACDVDLNQVKVFFSEEVNAIDANAPANYELRRAVNGTFGDSDDVIYPLTPSYSYNSSTAESVATVGILPTGGTLPDGDYRLTVFGRASNSIHDTAGNRLDGNRDGSVTGSNPDDYVRQFFIGNSAPTNITLSPTSIAENAGNDVLVGEFSSTDPDIGNTFAYTFASGTGDSDNSSFTINGNQLRAASSFNFETKSSYTVRVRSTDQGGLFVEKVFTIQVTDVNENPTNIALSAVSIPENSGVNTTVGALSTVDPDAGSSFTYALVSGNGDTDNGAFNIDGVNLRATNSFDFESKSSYTVRIRSTDQAGLWTEKSFTIQVLDKNESPSDIVLSSNTVPENAGPNAVVGTLSTTDADANNTFTYSLATGAGDSDNAAFNIDGNKLRATNSLDYETKPTYTVRVRSTDQGGLYTEKSFTIQVSNVPEGVEIFGTSGNDVFVATYTGDATNHAWLVTRGGATVFNGPIAADTPLVIDGLAGTDSLQINGRSVDDLVTLEGNTIRVNGAILQTIRNESVKSVTGLGNDRLTINMPLASGTSYSYDGGTGTDTFEASSGDNTWSVTGAGIGTLNTSFAFLGIESLRGGSGTDQFILGLNGKLIGQVIGGAGNDTLNMSAKTAAHTVNLQTNTATSTGGIGGIESFIGGNSATINDILIGPNSATNWTIDGTNAGSLTSATTNTVSFVGFESLTGGTAVDAFVLTNSGVLTKTLTGGTATGVIDTLNLSAKTSALDFRLDASTSNIPNAIGGYVGFETITANGHADTKITRVNNTTSAWSINTAGHVLISNVTYVQVFGIVGGAGTDTLTGPALSVDNMTHWRLDSAGGGIVSIPGATIGFTGMNNLTGNTGADAFEILPSGSISGNINAGTGTGLNSISYQQWTTSVSVNLSVTTAGNASGITGSLTNIQMVTGGSGNDTLRGQSTKATVIVGLAGSDTLVGGSQRDLLLGGVGADNLSGVASDDVLVSGTTSYDTNRDALFKIYSEWISTRTFAQRAANIWGNGTGTRLNGSYFLNNSPEPADSITDTVFSDGDLDSLTGGLNQDWFFAAGNEIVDLLSGDRKDG